MNRFKNIALLFLPVIALLLPVPVPMAVAAEEPIGTPETIILISLDTTRADRMSCYGYEHETTPNIDALAKDSLFFEDPFATAPMTLPSHSSMFTGLIPPSHGVHENLNFTLPQSALTLPEILKQQGFTTYGIVSSMVLRSDRGLNQGFDHYDDVIDHGTADSPQTAFGTERNGKETTARALQWLSANAAKKKFMFIHYFDAHNPFEPPPPFDTRFEDPYDGEIAFTDYCVGQILDRLKELGLYENALIALVGDHGEMLGEHDERYHSFFIYRNVLRVPMMFKPPGAIQSKRIKEPTSLIDVTPTLLSMAGLTVPDSMQGVNLARYLRSNFTLPDRAIYSESMTPTAFNCNSLLGIVMEQWHYIQTARPELYDRIKDPAEMNNLIAQYPTQASKMKDELVRILTETERAEVGVSEAPDPETLEQLKSLGYIESNVVVDYSFAEGKEDAKDMILVANRITEAIRMEKSGQRGLAIKSIGDIIQEHPKVSEAYYGLSTIYYNGEEHDKAVAVLERLLTLVPEDRSALIKIFGIYEKQRDFPKAIDILNRLIALKPNDGTAYELLIDIYMRQASFDKALEAMNTMHAVIPRNSETMTTLGVIYARHKDLPNALASFLDALDLDPKSNAARINAAGMYLNMDDLSQALLLYEEALDQDSSNPEIHRIVANIKLNKDHPQLYDPRSALIQAQIALQLRKDTKLKGMRDIPAFLETLAKAWAANGRFDAATTLAARALELYTSMGYAVQADKMRGLIEEYAKQIGSHR